MPLPARPRWIRKIPFLPLVPLSIAALAEPAGPEAGAGRSAKTIIDLQPYRQSSAIRIRDDRGAGGLATLINLNPGINAWYLLRIAWDKGTGRQDYHLENTAPGACKLVLDAEYPSGIVLAEGEKRSLCELWQTAPRNVLHDAAASGAVYASLCGGRIYLRNPAQGYRTAVESAAEFLRNKVPAGEKIETFVRDKFIVEAYREKAKTAAEPQRSSASQPQASPQNGLAAARLDLRQANRIITTSHLGIRTQQSTAEGIIPGSWYPVLEAPGVYVSLITAGMIAPEILDSYRKRVNVLDAEEKDSLVYLAAFDLDQFAVKYTRGTDHPRLNWSDHILERMRDKLLSGPDGIGTVAPLVSTGLISPADAGRTAAVFAGGFKRTHGAFNWGELATKNFGSHYGFMEQGVVESTLQPGLATIYTLADGLVEMKTWAPVDHQLLPRVVSARQNGVPIIDSFDRTTEMSVPGPLVSRWGEGNWSGSVDRKLRTVRAAAALQEVDGKRFLLYAVFTGATPSAMARVFQAYQCSYAMPLDMNALELTYLALYIRKGPDLHVGHLIQGMAEADKLVKGKYLPRFLSYPDNRDFFYLLRKEKR